MAQFGTDFSGNTTGEVATEAAPTGVAGWTARMPGASSWASATIAASGSSIGGKVLQFRDTGSGLPVGIYPTSIGAVAANTATEILVGWRVASGMTAATSFFLYAPGYVRESTTTAGNRYQVGLTKSGATETQQLWYVQGQTDWTNVGASKDISADFVPGDWWWTRIQVDADHDWRWRSWKDGTSEPGTWQNTDANHSTVTSGYVGVGLAITAGNEELDVQWFGVGTAGDPAPEPNLAPTQTAVPDADITDGAWTPSTGADLFAVLDETAADDGDYISVTSNSECEIGLQTLSTPQAGTRTFRYRHSGSAAKKLIAKLYQGAALVESWTHDPCPSALTTSVQTIANAISSFADLRIRFETGAATSPPTLQVTWGAVGTGASGTTTANPSYPTGISAATSKLIAVCTGVSSTAGTAFSAPAGWTSLGQFEGGAGTFGVDTGQRRVGYFIKDTVTGSESGTTGNFSFAAGSATTSTMRVTIHRVEVPSGYGIDTEFTSGADTTNGTGYSATASGNNTFQANDLLLIAVAQNIDSGTQSAQSITASGITFGTRTNRASTAVTNGNDHRHIVDSVPVSSGSGTVAPTYAYTISSSGSGPTGFLRLRAVAPTEAARVTWAEVEVPEAAGAAPAPPTRRFVRPMVLARAGTPLALRRALGMPAALRLSASVVDLAGAAVAQASSAAALQLLVGLAGAAAATASASGDPSKTVSLGASAAGSASAQAELAKAVQLAVAAAAQASGNGALALSVLLNGAATALGSATGALSTSGTVDLAGAAAGEASATAALSLSVNLLATALGQSGAGGGLQLSLPLDGAAVVVAGAGGALALSIALAGAPLGQASAGASFNTVVSIGGSAAAAAGVAGTLALTVPLDAAALAIAAAGGGLVLTVQIGGAGAAQGGASAAAALGKPLAGAALGQALASGAFSTTITLAGSSGGQAQLVGQLAGFAPGAPTQRAWRVRPAQRRWRAAPVPRRWIVDHTRQGALQ